MAKNKIYDDVWLMNEWNHLCSCFLFKCYLLTFDSWRQLNMNFCLQQQQQQNGKRRFQWILSTASDSVDSNQSRRFWRNWKVVEPIKKQQKQFWPIRKHLRFQFECICVLKLSLALTLVWSNRQEGVMRSIGRLCQKNEIKNTKRPEEDWPNVIAQKSKRTTQMKANF